MGDRYSEAYHNKGSSVRGPTTSDESYYKSRDRNREKEYDVRHHNRPTNEGTRMEEKYRGHYSRRRSPSRSSSSYSSSRSRSRSRSRSPYPNEKVVPSRGRAKVPGLSGLRGNLDNSEIQKDKNLVCSKVPSPPPPPRISKVSLTLGKSSPVKASSVKLKLGGFQVGPKPTAPKKPIGIASAFNQDSDDEQEEMPSEARMRMRNIGRETPTSAGPNSFGKTKQGFCDSKKMFEKNLREAMDK